MPDLHFPPALESPLRHRSMHSIIRSAVVANIGQRADVLIDYPMGSRIIGSVMVMDVYPITLAAGGPIVRRQQRPLSAFQQLCFARDCGAVSYHALRALYSGILGASMSGFVHVFSGFEPRSGQVIEPKELGWGI